MNSHLSQDLLLSYLDARVQTRPCTKEVKGRVCVGVRRAGRTRWWIADFAKAIKTSLADDLPAEFDAALAVDAHTALWVLGAAKERGRMHITTGDRRLLKAFVRLYLKPSNAISIRVAGDR
jgi:hypothetical protein